MEYEHIVDIDRFERNLSRYDESQLDNMGELMDYVQSDPEYSEAERNRLLGMIGEKWDELQNLRNERLEREEQARNQAEQRRRIEEKRSAGQERARQRQEERRNRSVEELGNDELIEQYTRLEQNISRMVKASGERTTNKNQNFDKYKLMKAKQKAIKAEMEKRGLKIKEPEAGKESMKSQRDKWEKQFMRTRKGFTSEQWKNEEDRIKDEIAYFKEKLTKSSSLKPEMVKELKLKLAESKFKLLKSQKEIERLAKKEKIEADAKARREAALKPKVKTDANKIEKVKKTDDLKKADNVDVNKSENKKTQTEPTAAENNKNDAIQKALENLEKMEKAKKVEEIKRATALEIKKYLQEKARREQKEQEEAKARAEAKDKADVIVKAKAEAEAQAQEQAEKMKKNADKKDSKDLVVVKNDKTKNIFKRIGAAIAAAAMATVAFLGVSNPFSKGKDKSKDSVDNNQSLSETYVKITENNRGLEDNIAKSENNIEINEKQTQQQDLTEKYEDNSKSFLESLKPTAEEIEQGKEILRNEKIENVLSDFKLGDVVELQEGTQYYETSQKEGRQGTIGDIPWRPAGEYVIDGVAVLNNDNEIIDYVYDEPGTNVKDFVDEHDIKNTHRAYHIATKAKDDEEKGEMTGWAEEDEILESLMKKHIESQTKTR